MVGERSNSSLAEIILKKNMGTQKGNIKDSEFKINLMFEKEIVINREYLKQIEFKQEIIDKYYNDMLVNSSKFLKIDDLKNDSKKIIDKFNMLLVPAGTFTFGDTFGDGEDDEKTTSRVTISSFYMGKYEVTFDEYYKYCDEKRISEPNDRGWGRGLRPVINVSWFDAVKYCNYLSEKAGLEKVYNETTWSFDITKNGYRLPTEAEWEYVSSGAFAGAKRKYPWGDSDPDSKKLNYNENVGKTTIVGSYPSYNGFYDMAGNVWEWCSDWYGSYTSTTKSNPVGSSSGSDRVLRGGGWCDSDWGTRSAGRSVNSPTSSSSGGGFRLVRSF
jgi:formylglycine-generating enzyme required for sulfatase activity